MLTLWKNLKHLLISGLNELQQQHMQSVHLPNIGRELVGGNTTVVCDCMASAKPDLWLASQLVLILLGD